MKLLKLYSDNKDFKTVHFKPGLNIVAGLQSSSLSTDSYNGIGKSSSLQLLHLMFGGSFDNKIASDKKLLDFLSTYGDMYLDFSIGTVSYTINKNFAKNDFYLNGKKISKTAFPQKISEVFLLNKTIDFKLKPLFNIFARRYLPERSYYAGALSQQGQRSTDYYQMLYNLTLLGLDTSLVKRNKVIADEISKLKKTEELLNKQKLSVNEEDYLDLKDELDKLTKAKNNFIIAPNYNDLKREADSLTLSMTDLRNEMHFNEIEVVKKKRLLEASNSDAIDISRVSHIYDEAKFHFTDIVVKRLEQAEEFHLNIQKSRKARLKDQVINIIHNNEIITKELGIIETKRDKLLKDLDSTGALEEYNSIVERIRTIDANISELMSYQTVLAQFEKDKASLELEKAQVKAESVKYLADNKIHLNDVASQFRSFVKQFYHGHGGSLNITNSKNAQYLYDVEPSIPKDGSQGINEVKIFCYDMLLYSLNPNLLGFVAHDSCIFSGVDPRQVETMFKVVLDMVSNNNLQYFVNMNKNTYEHLVNSRAESELNLPEDKDVILTKEEKDIIKESTILELFDAEAKNTLFGRTFG